MNNLQKILLAEQGERLNVLGKIKLVIKKKKIYQNNNLRIDISP
jgi:hypothetical protein